MKRNRNKLSERLSGKWSFSQPQSQLTDLWFKISFEALAEVLAEVLCEVLAEGLVEYWWEVWREVLAGLLGGVLAKPSERFRSLRTWPSLAK